MNRSITLVTLSFALFPIALGADPAPRSGRWQFSVPVEVVWHLDNSYEVFRRSHSGSPGVNLSRDFSPLDRPMTLFVDLGYRHESFSNTIATSLSSRLDTDWLNAGFGARYALHRFIEPYARLSAGAAYTRMSLGSTQPIEDSRWMPFGTLGVGVMARSAALAPGTLRRLGLSFSLEGGLLVAPSIGYSLSAPLPDDDEVANDLVAVRPTQVGSLNASGPYFRAVFGLRF